MAYRSQQVNFCSDFKIITALRRTSPDVISLYFSNFMANFGNNSFTAIQSGLQSYIIHYL